MRQCGAERLAPPSNAHGQSGWLWMKILPTPNRSILAKSVPSQNQTVVHPSRLMIFQPWQVGERGRFRFIEHGPGHGLQGAPSWPIQVRRMCHLPQKAPPLDYDTINVAWPDQVSYPGMLCRGIFMNCCHHQFSARSIFRRHAVFQVTRNGLQAELS